MIRRGSHPEDCFTCPRCGEVDWHLVHPYEVDTDSVADGVVYVRFGCDRCDTVWECEFSYAGGVIYDG